MRQIVWIVGSGFSKPLGGPLFRDLFTDQVRDYVIHTFAPHLKDTTSVHQLVRLFQERGAYWDNNAEAFLGYVDAAAEGQDPGAARLLKSWMQGRKPLLGSFQNAQQLGKLARRYMALATHYFVHRGLYGEGWDAYAHWLKKVVHSEDTIISFNYDLVLERLSGKCDWAYDHGLQEVPDGGTSLLKLHGSVNWTMGSNGPFDLAHAEDETLGDDIAKGGFVPAIGVPGPGKHDFQERLKPLWRKAEEALERAEAVVILGYSFPATDAGAVRQLASRIGIAQHHQGRTARPPVHIVLWRDHEAAQRVTDLVLARERDSDGGHVHRHQLSAQDFVALFERDRILDPSKRTVRRRPSKYWQR